MAKNEGLTGQQRHDRKQELEKQKEDRRTAESKNTAKNLFRANGIVGKNLNTGITSR